VHGVVAGMSDTSVGSRLKIQNSGPVGEALTLTYVGGKGREVEVICDRRIRGNKQRIKRDWTDCIG
jgi:hypothetical protein